MNISNSTTNIGDIATLRYSDIIEKLIALGLSPLPVAPYQSEPISKKSQKPIFTGKNPSYLDKANGFPKTVVHKNYSDTIPTQFELAEWFGNPKNGIGCLGSHRYRWLDLDRKHFDSQEDCDRALDTICAPDIRSIGWVERTQSGGYRLLVDCGESGAEFTNFALTEGGDHVGELLGAGRFAVLAPSIGVSGNPYTNISYGAPIPFSSLNIFTTAKKREAVAIKPSMPRIASSDAIELFSCVTPAVQSIITGNPESDDRSADITKAAKELYGWENWLNANQINFKGSADNLINDCGDVFGIDSDRIERIKKSINSASCLPACVILGGDDSAVKHVKKLRGASGRTNPQDLDQSDDEKLCRIKFLAKKINDIYGDRFKLNLLRSEIELDGEIFDLDQSRYFFGVKENLNISKSDAVDIVRAIAINNQFHPVKEYLESCAAKYPKSDIFGQLCIKSFWHIRTHLLDLHKKDVSGCCRQNL
jgi:Predicted P-loop ATPase and inactivated derivatives